MEWIKHYVLVAVLEVASIPGIFNLLRMEMDIAIFWDASNGFVLPPPNTKPIWSHRGKGQRRCVASKHPKYTADYSAAFRLVTAVLVPIEAGLTSSALDIHHRSVLDDRTQGGHPGGELAHQQDGAGDTLLAESAAWTDCWIMACLDWPVQSQVNLHMAPVSSTGFTRHVRAVFRQLSLTNRTRSSFPDRFRPSLALLKTTKPLRSVLRRA